MDWSDLLDLLGNKVSNNLAGSNALISNQTALAAKQFQNPDYQPTPQEDQNSSDYYKNVSQAVSGSVAPEGGILGAVEPATEAANAFGQNAVEQAQSQNALSKAHDMADRYKQQYAQTRLNALNALRNK